MRHVPALVVFNFKRIATNVITALRAAWLPRSPQLIHRWGRKHLMRKQKGLDPACDQWGGAPNVIK